MFSHEYEIGLHKGELDTPALLIDLDAMERNLAKMASFFAGCTATLRPHVKLHRATPILAHKQLLAGGKGVTCAKLGEAEVLVAAGISDDILIANQIVGERKIRRLVHLAKHANLMVAVDNPRNVQALSDAAHANGVHLRVLVEVDIGHHRCGVPPFEPALNLAQQVAHSAGLRFMGLMGYDGQNTLRAQPEEREQQSRAANMLLAETRHYLETAGLPVSIVSASGTFTYRYVAALPGITEVQAGTYLLMDTTFQEKGVEEFECALTVLGTITSRTHRPGSEHLAIIDVGRKTMETGWGLPKVKYPLGATVPSMSQEHGRLLLARAESVGGALDIGDQVELWVSDASNTINLFDKFYAMRNSRVEAVWDIPGRGKSA